MGNVYSAGLQLRSEFELESQYYYGKSIGFHTKKKCPVGLGCRIHRLLLCRKVSPPNECPGYDTKQSDGLVPAMLELWGMQRNLSLPSLPGLHWLGVVPPSYLWVK